MSNAKIPYTSTTTYHILNINRERLEEPDSLREKKKKTEKERNQPLT